MLNDSAIQQVQPTLIKPIQPNRNILQEQLNEKINLNSHHIFDAVYLKPFGNTFQIVSENSTLNKLVTLIHNSQIAYASDQFIKQTMEVEDIETGESIKYYYVLDTVINKKTEFYTEDLSEIIDDYIRIISAIIRFSNVRFNVIN